MRKFPRSERRSLAGLGQAVVVFSRRGTASSSADAETGSVSQTYYVSSVLGGKGDLEIPFVAGVAQPPMMAMGRSLEIFSYLIGPVPIMDTGYGWNGNGEVAIPFAHQVSEERFETYALGNITGPGMSDGTGWNGSPLIH